ncbi:hypothetical protein [Kitasatospora sp. P5_F3]
MSTRPSRPVVLAKGGSARISLAKADPEAKITCTLSWQGREDGRHSDFDLFALHVPAEAVNPAAAATTDAVDHRTPGSLTAAPHLLHSGDATVPRRPGAGHEGDVGADDGQDVAGPQPGRGLVLGQRRGGDALQLGEGRGDPHRVLGEEPRPQLPGLREDDAVHQALLVQPARAPAHLLRARVRGVQDAQLLGGGHPELVRRGDHGVVDLGRHSHHGLLEGRCPPPWWQWAPHGSPRLSPDFSPVEAPAVTIRQQAH